MANGYYVEVKNEKGKTVKIRCYDLYSSAKRHSESINKNGGGFFVATAHRCGEESVRK